MAKTARHKGVIIRPRETKTGKSYRVECPIPWFGRPAFRQFKTSTEAKDFIDQQLNRRDHLGVLGNRLTPEQIVDAAEALKLLGDRGVRLTDCVQHYLDSSPDTQPSCLVSDAVEAYLQAREGGSGLKYTRKLSERGWSDIQGRMDVFNRDFAGRDLGSITADCLEAWLGNPEWSEQSKLNYFAAVRTFFGYAVRKGLLTDDPTSTVTRPNPPRALPEIYSVGDFARMLEAAKDQDRYPGVLAALVFGGFCGIRPQELHRLDWGNVNWDESFVTVPPHAAKTRKIRNVTLPECAKQWLSLLPDRDGPLLVTPARLRKRRDKLCEDLGLKWIQDGLRHTAASHHFAHFQNAATTCAELGHATDRVLFDHYRAVVSRKDAEKFFNLTP